MEKAISLKNTFVPQVVPGTTIAGEPEAASVRDESIAILSGLLASSSWHEIVTRLREVAKVNGGAAADSGTAGAAAPEVIEMDELRIEKHAHRVFVGTREVSLTSLEFRLLITLVDRRDHVQPRGTLLTDVWGHHPSSRTRTVDTHVRRLRDKLGSAGAFIHTVRGVGYRFSERPSIRSRDGRCVVRAHSEIAALAG